MLRRMAGARVAQVQRRAAEAAPTPEAPKPPKATPTAAEEAAADGEADAEDSEAGRASQPAAVRMTTVGFVGHPNVGKTSLLNAIVGRKVASVSRTPGHTKHLQTWQLSPTLTVCDSPGLVFPVGGALTTSRDVPPRAVYECCGLYPIAQVRESFSAVRLLAETLELERLYNIREEDREGDDDPLSPLALCAALAVKRGYTLRRGGAPDVHRAGLEVLRDCVDGALCLAFAPPPPEASAE